jgi:hypothetical protein
VGAALVWGVGYDRDRPSFTGSDDPASGGGRILHYDLEVSAFAAGRSGHLVALGLRDIDFSSDPFRTPKTGLSLPAWAKAQGERVVVGMAHGQFWPAAGFPSPPVACCMPWEFPIQAAHGGVSFLITERRGDGPPIDPGTFLLWRALQNSGFRIALLGASDYPCIHRAIDDTSPRTDVIVNGPLTYEGWLEGIRRGRTVVTLDARHRLNLRVNGAPLGSEVAPRGRVLLVSVESGRQYGGGGAVNGRPPPARPPRADRWHLVRPARQFLGGGADEALHHRGHLRRRGQPVRTQASIRATVRYTDHLSDPSEREDRPRGGHRGGPRRLAAARPR